MYRLLSVLFVVSSITLVAQSTKPSVKQNAPHKTPVPSSTTTTGPKGEVLKPKDINYGESTIPGDSEVLSNLSDLNLLSEKYQEELKEFQTKLNEKYGPEWDREQQKIQKSIQKVKDANNWGGDVVFDASTKQWIKLTPEEVKSMKKAIDESETNK